MTEYHDDTVEADLKPSAARFYGWRVVWIGAFILVIGSYEQGLPQLLRFTLGEVVVRRGSLTFAVAHGLLTGLLPLLLMPLAGWAVDRWGARRLVLWGLLALGVGAILYLGHQVSWVLYVSLFFVGVGGVVGTILPAAAAVNNWFVSRRAMAMAVLSLPLVMVGFLFEALRSSVEIGPRTASLTVAAIVLVLAWPLSRLIRNRPEYHDQHPDGIAPGQRRGLESDAKGCGDALAPNYTWRESLRTRAFWFLVVGGAVFSVSSVGLFFNALMMRQSGFEPALSGGALWIDGAAAILFVLVGGWVGGRPLPHTQGHVCIRPFGSVRRRCPGIRGIVADVLSFGRNCRRGYWRDAAANPGRSRGLLRPPQLRHDNRTVSDAPEPG